MISLIYKDAHYHKYFLNVTFWLIIYLTFICLKFFYAFLFFAVLLNIFAKKFFTFFLKTSIVNLPLALLTKNLESCNEAISASLV